MNVIFNWTGLSAELEAANQLSGNVFPALRRLDYLLQRSVLAAHVVYGPEAASDPYRGLHISEAEAKRLCTRKPGEPFLWCDDKEESVACPDAEGLRFVWLKETFDLSNFDLDLLIIALAPEIDLRYERLYAYLQDDVTRRKPTVDLVLNLLCPTAEEKLARRANLNSGSPLIRHRLIRLVAPHTSLILLCLPVSSCLMSR